MGADAARLSQGRAQIINVWRPLRGPVQDVPLAVADYRTISPEDLVPADLRYEDRTGETYSVRFNEKHRFWWVKDQGPDEVSRTTLFTAFRSRSRPAVLVLTARYRHLSNRSSSSSVTNPIRTRISPVSPLTPRSSTRTHQRTRSRGRASRLGLWFFTPSDRSLAIVGSDPQITRGCYMIQCELCKVFFFFVKICTIDGAESLETHQDREIGQEPPHIVNTESSSIL